MALGGRPSVSLPCLVASLEEPGPSGSGEPEQSSQKRKRSSTILEFLKEEAEKEERRESDAAERSERFLSLFAKFIDKV